jgi:5-methyltetrahydrofolate--homocysteine methyltransferase
MNQFRHCNSSDRARKQPDSNLFISRVNGIFSHRDYEHQTGTGLLPEGQGMDMNDSEFVSNLQERKETYTRFWNGENLGRPILSIHAKREQARPGSSPPPFPANLEAYWLDPDYVIPSRLDMLSKTEFLGDSIPHISVDLGPGSLAAYLGSPIVLDYLTVWYKENLTSLEDKLPIFDAENIYWQQHLELISRAAATGFEKGFYVAVPDFIEGLDTLASLRGTEALVFDLMDPDLRPQAHLHLKNITELYFRYYDLVHQQVTDSDGWNMCTYLEPFGQGRTCKIQCDFAALMDPDLFAEFALPYIEMQAAEFDHVSYHLDGPGAIYSAPMVASVENIKVIQWIPGAGAAPEYDVQWEAKVLDTLIDAGKTVEMVFMPDYLAPESKQRTDLTKIVAGLNRLIAKYGAEKFWFIFKFGFREALVREILFPAARNWGVPVE